MTQGGLYPLTVTLSQLPSLMHFKNFSGRLIPIYFQSRIQSKSRKAFSLVSGVSTPEIPASRAHIQGKSEAPA